MTEMQDAVAILEDLFGDTPGYREGVAEASENLQIATLIYEARVAAGLSQKQLAGKIHTRQSVISRLEDADYTGHSLTMLRRVASALGLRLEIALCPAAASEASPAAPSRPAPALRRPASEPAPVRAVPA